MKIMRFFFFLFLATLLSVAAPASSDVVKEATDAFMNNKPKEAIPLLQAAIEEQPENEEIYFYLGVAYEQLEDWQSAAEIYREGLTLGKKESTFLFNMGNNYARMGQHQKALDAYTRAITRGGELPEAYLNRANLRVKIKDYQAAIADYRVYLSMKPNAPQKSNIEKMVSLLSDKLRTAEERRQEEERKQKEEEERKKQLLEQVLGSLEESSGETKNLSAGTGEVKEYEEDFDIVE